jgi:hypothetical protein
MNFIVVSLDVTNLFIINAKITVLENGCMYTVSKSYLLHSQTPKALFGIGGSHRIYAIFVGF